MNLKKIKDSLHKVKDAYEFTKNKHGIREEVDIKNLDQARFVAKQVANDFKSSLARTKKDGDESYQKVIEEVIKGWQDISRAKDFPTMKSIYESLPDDGTDGGFYWDMMDYFDNADKDGNNSVKVFNKTLKKTADSSHHVKDHQAFKDEKDRIGLFNRLKPALVKFAEGDDDTQAHSDLRDSQTDIVADILLEFYDKEELEFELEHAGFDPLKLVANLGIATPSEIKSVESSKESENIPLYEENKVIMVQLSDSQVRSFKKVFDLNSDGQYGREANGFELSGNTLTGRGSRMKAALDFLRGDETV